MKNLVVVKQSKIGNKTLTLEVEERNNNDFWKINIAGEVIYPLLKDEGYTKVRKRLEYSQVRETFYLIRTALSIYSDYKQCEDCYNFKEGVKSYRIDFLDAEKIPDYFYAELCPDCAVLKEKEEGFVSIQEKKP